MCVYTSTVQLQECRRAAPSLHAFCYLCAVHDQGVNDPVSSLSAAHSLHAAVVVAQCEMGFRAVVHKLALQVQTHEQLRLAQIPYCTRELI